MPQSLRCLTLTNTDVGAAPVNTTLTDAAASSTLPATTATALTALRAGEESACRWTQVHRRVRRAVD